MEDNNSTYYDTAPSHLPSSASFMPNTMLSLPYAPPPPPQAPPQSPARGVFDDLEDDDMAYYDIDPTPIRPQPFFATERNTSDVLPRVVAPAPALASMDRGTASILVQYPQQRSNSTLSPTFQSYSPDSASAGHLPTPSITTIPTATPAIANRTLNIPSTATPATAIPATATPSITFSSSSLSVTPSTVPRFKSSFTPSTSTPRSAASQPDRRPPPPKIIPNRVDKGKSKALPLPNSGWMSGSDDATKSQDDDDGGPQALDQFNKIKGPIELDPIYNKPLVDRTIKVELPSKPGSIPRTTTIIRRPSDRRCVALIFRISSPTAGAGFWTAPLMERRGETTEGARSMGEGDHAGGV